MSRPRAGAATAVGEKIPRANSRGSPRARHPIADKSPGAAGRGRGFLWTPKTARLTAQPPPPPVPHFPGCHPPVVFRSATERPCAERKATEESSFAPRKNALARSERQHRVVFRSAKERPVAERKATVLVARRLNECWFWTISSAPVHTSPRSRPGPTF